MSRPPGRVLWLTKGLGLGGAERLAALLVPRLAARGWHIDVAYVLPHKDALVGALRAGGTDVRCLGGAGRSGLGWLPRLRRLLRDGGYDLVHTHSPVAAAAARALRGRHGPGRPILLHTEHNVWQRYRTPTRLANVATFGRNAAAIAVSHGVAESMVAPMWAWWTAMPPVEVVLHGVDETAVRSGADARRTARRALGLDDRDVVVGTVGNFTPKKNHAALLDAFRLLADTDDRFRLVLVGSGPLESAMRARAQRDGLADRVLFTGSRDDAQELLPALDAYVVSSRYEGLSIALLEAMASGVPCVATAVGGVPEVLENGRDGLLVPPGDPGAIAEGVRRLLDRPEQTRAFVASARDTASRFSIGNAAIQTSALYDSVLGRIGAMT